MKISAIFGQSERVNDQGSFFMLLYPWIIDNAFFIFGVKVRLLVWNRIEGVYWGVVVCDVLCDARLNCWIGEMMGLKALILNCTVWNWGFWPMQHQGVIALVWYTLWIWLPIMPFSKWELRCLIFCFRSFSILECFHHDKNFCYEWEEKFLWWEEYTSNLFSKWKKG